MPSAEALHSHSILCHISISICCCFILFFSLFAFLERLMGVNAWMQFETYFVLDIRIVVFPLFCFAFSLFVFSQLLSVFGREWNRRHFRKQPVVIICQSILFWLMGYIASTSKSSISPIFRWFHKTRTHTHKHTNITPVKRVAVNQVMPQQVSRTLWLSLTMSRQAATINVTDRMMAGHTDCRRAWWFGMYRIHNKI